MLLLISVKRHFGMFLNSCVDVSLSRRSSRKGDSEMSNSLFNLLSISTFLRTMGIPVQRSSLRHLVSLDCFHPIPASLLL